MVASGVEERMELGVKQRITEELSNLIPELYGYVSNFYSDNRGYITFSNAYQHLKNDGERENSNFHEIEIHHSLITEQ